MEITSFHPFVFDTVNRYIILCRRVVGAGSMAWSHETPHKVSDPLVPNEVVHFLYVLRLTQPQPRISYHKLMHF